ncbi:MAG TPA: AAA family ATPase [Candidatus Binataceae bacterium]|nr:AAA family ATPase [Candidatus Binataceae bacterium]
MTDSKRLVATLTAPARGALERAAERALRERHATIELEHLLLELCRGQDTDLAFLMRNERLDPQPLQAGLEAAVARFTSGSPRIPALSGELVDTLGAAWVVASVDQGLAQLGSASIVYAARENAARRAALLASVPALSPIFANRLAQDLPEWLRLGSEIAVTNPGPPKPVGAASILAAYTIDLTAQARAGRIDPVIGRDAEIRQIIDVLMRRQQNNPILTGPAGVGKTAIVEGFASAIAAGRVPPRLADLVVCNLDLGLLQAGASMRGEFEQRLRTVIDEASTATPRTVLFIDEAHMLIGAGGAAGQADAANLLKPALARGALGVIAATTWGEYKRFFEKDPALARRFQVIRVAEPTETVAVEMLRGLAPKLEAHHGVSILEEALAEAVRLSHRFIAGRQLPEKAISVLDTACAHVAIARSTAPAELADAEQRSAALEAELTRLRREAALQADRAERLAALEEALARAEAERRLRELEELQREKRLAANGADSRAIAKSALGKNGIAVSPKVNSARSLKARTAERIIETMRLSRRFLSGRQLPEKAIFVLDPAYAHTAATQNLPAGGLADAERRCAALEAEIIPLRREAALQADRAERLEALEQTFARAEEQRRRELEAARAGKGLTATSVDRRAIAAVVSGWTGIPVGQMLADTLTNARSLKARMAERIIDQDAALDTICRRIQTFYADLGEPNKPTGVFLLCGPSGVGKTETALTLAELLFGGARSLVSVNMSEYQEAHSVSGLRGAPPGYVGYGSGGTLTEAVRRQPYCVLLLDEVEKAHPDVLEMFYQVFDRGVLEDSEGQMVDFTNTIILLTSNLGAELLSKMAERNPTATAEVLTAAIRPTLLRQFSAAFLGRLVVVPYQPLGRAGIEAVTRLKLQRIQERFATTSHGELTYDRRVIGTIAERAGATESGARMVDTILTHSVLPALSGCILDNVAEGRPIAGAHLSVAGDGGIVVTLKP